ncbi:MAG TPA: hypothetical protein VF950_21545 [Planctomycetota bacterium]
MDYLLKTSGPRLTQVRRIKHKDNYSPAQDFYKMLRDGIVRHHSQGELDKTKLDVLVENAHAPKKLNYSRVVSGYKKFLGRKDIAWTGTLREDWTYNSLKVVVNPELGMEIDGKHHQIKMYFKDEDLTKSKVAVILQLMKSALDDGAEAGTVFGVLDIRSSKLYTHSSKEKDLTALLEGEADGFISIWNKV